VTPKKAEQFKNIFQQIAPFGTIQQQLAFQVHPFMKGFHAPKQQ